MASKGGAAVNSSLLLDSVLIDGVDSGDLDDYDSVTLEHGDASLSGSRGARLHTQWWRPCGPPRGAVVIVHGLTDHSARYGTFAERLVASGLAVHAFDLRGHGRSAGARAWVDSFDDYLQDLDLVVQNVRAREGVRPLFVFGHGMGGAIAALWQLEGRVPISGLVLSGAALQPRPVPVGARAIRLLSAIAPRTGILQLDVRRNSRDRGTVEDALRDTLVNHRPAPARTARELLEAMRRIDARAHELTTPALAIHGLADVVSDPEGSRRLMGRIGSSDKQLYEYHGLAHDLLHEPERVRVMRDVKDWLKERARG